MTASGDRRFGATHRRFIIPTVITRATIGGSTCQIVVGVLSSGSAAPRSQRSELRAELLRIALPGQGVADPRSVGVEHDADGAPALSSPHIGSVSFSYDGLWAVVAISPSEGRIGVDVQMPRRVSPTVLRRFAPDLVTRADDRSTYSEFARRWAAREAASKAAGTGLRGELLRTVLPVARAGRDFGATYTVLDGWTFPALSLAHKD
ncbi:4'-phosphopantetheinyl transferase superfamily protein [Streptomyces sp. NPDC048179]|uniref:4'-phosphopantetheinyl transferase superfamily protein n=1 Tax=Streptomyces sp. NPDC048179 TaxID=3365506 RepID=UPI0037217631